MDAPRKNLVYFVVFTRPERALGRDGDTIEQLAICLASLRRTSDPSTFDVLFVADAAQAEKIRALPEVQRLTYEIGEITFPADLTLARSARFKLHALLGDALARYEKVLYADVDVVFLRDVRQLFDQVIDPGLLYVKADHWGGTSTENLSFSLDGHSADEARRFAEGGVEVFSSGQFAFVNGPAMAALFADLDAAIPALAPRSRQGFEQPIVNSVLRSRHLERPCLEESALDEICHLETDELPRTDQAVLVHFFRADKLRRMKAELEELGDPAALAEAMAHHQKGRLREAEECYRRGLKAVPENTKARSLFGFLLFKTGRHAEAIGMLDQSLATNPDQADAHAWRGLCLQSLGRIEEATSAFTAAVRVDPRHMGAHHNLGLVLVDQGRGNDALPHLQRAVELGYKRPEPFVLMGRAHVMTGRLVEAERAYREALKLNPGFVDARVGLANVLQNLGELDAAITELRGAIEASPQALGARSSLMMKLLYHDRLTPEQVAREHHAAGRAYLDAFASGGDPVWRKRSADPDRRLRVAYLSPDYHLHATAFFLEPLLAAHDPAQVEVFCYSNTKQRDAVTERLRGLAHGWRDIFGMQARDAAALIAEDRIDLLVDCAGHTSNHRLDVLAMKPAPLQITWLGYPHGTGLTTMDHRFTDAIADPPGMTESHYVEALVRLPEGTFCYRAPDTAPAPSPGPLERGEGPVFGCFNNPHKIGPKVIRLWAEIVNAVPGARLRLAAKQFLDAATVARFRERFAAAGLAPERLEIEGRRTFAEGFGLYATLDVALDPFPYHGTTSTCEALWMAVPVVTLPGRSCVSRVGPSLLSRVGLDDLVARDEAHYRDLAVGLARDPARLAELRRTLRDRVARSALCDGPRFARQMEAAYRDLWRAFCAGEH